MMREIKFRIWNTFEKMFYVSDGYVMRGNGELYGLDEDHCDAMSPQTVNSESGGLFHLSRIDDSTIFAGQYTGLKDKNGTEIYEGDILKGGIYKTFEVEWFGDATSWNITKIGVSVFEVIGNIHENPDLIN